MTPAALDGPAVVVTDYMKVVPDQAARWVPDRLVPPGTDAYGRSDTREALHRFFEVDAGHVVVAVLTALVGERKIGSGMVAAAIARHGIGPGTAGPRDRRRAPPIRWRDKGRGSIVCAG
ncbi:MAG: hypothetical protein ABIJ48_03005 [Actinomycetota bacterium]